MLTYTLQIVSTLLNSVSKVKFSTNLIRKADFSDD